MVSKQRLSIVKIDPARVVDIQTGDHINVALLVLLATLRHCDDINVNIKTMSLLI